MASVSVPPRSTTKVVTSVDLTMSPCFSASSSLRWVGSSVCEDLSSLSAMGSAQEASHLGGVVVEEQRHQRAHQQHHDEEARQNVDRLCDEEDLNLRHKTRHQADGGVDGGAEHQK